MKKLFILLVFITFHSFSQDDNLLNVNYWGYDLKIDLTLLDKDEFFQKNDFKGFKYYEYRQRSNRMGIWYPDSLDITENIYFHMWKNIKIPYKTEIYVQNMPLSERHIKFQDWYKKSEIVLRYFNMNGHTVLSKVGEQLNKRFYCTDSPYSCPELRKRFLKEKGIKPIYGNYISNRNILREEITYKGYEDIYAYGGRIQDGFVKGYDEFGRQKHFEKFFINNYLVAVKEPHKSQDDTWDHWYFKGEISWYRNSRSFRDVIELDRGISTDNIPRSSENQNRGLSVTEANEYDLEFMINLFLDDLYNNQCTYFSFDYEKFVDCVDDWAEKELLQELATCQDSDKINCYVDSQHMLSTSETYWADTVNALVPGMGSRKTPRIIATFEKLEDGTLAKAYGIDDDDIIILKVDPMGWENSSSAKRWYTIYHELGHDVLNLRHGQGGKMMFNYSKIDYTWVEFNDDRNYMFNWYFEKKLERFYK